MLVFGLYLVIGDRLAPSETTIARGDQSDVGNVGPVPSHPAVTLPSRVDDPQDQVGQVRPSVSAHTKNHLKPDQGKARRVSSPAPAVRNVETRGNENPCSNKTTVNLESVPDGEDVILKWNAVKGAASYDVYIADLDENLIDHFESRSQTSFRTNVIFEPEKTYRWKLIITLANGNRIVGPPQVLKKAGTGVNAPIRSEAIEKQRTSFELRCVGTK